MAYALIMKFDAAEVALLALVLATPSAAFAPVTNVRRSRALGQPLQTPPATCALPSLTAPVSGVSNIITGVSSTSHQHSVRWRLAGTGPSYDDVVAEIGGEDADGEDDEEDDRDGDEEGEVGGKKKKKSKKVSSGDKQKVKLEAEVTFFEGGPDPSEMVAPAVSILTVIGIVPFSASVARQAWVKYTITSRRIKVVSGWGGKDTTEVVYPDIVNMVYVWRFFGRCGDVVITLRDGSKLEIRSLPDFEKNYQYIFDRTSARCQAESQVMTIPE